MFRALHEHIARAARDRRAVSGIRLHVESHDEAARRTYGALGFARTDYLVLENDGSSAVRKQD